MSQKLTLALHGGALGVLVVCTDALTFFPVNYA